MDSGLVDQPGTYTAGIGFSHDTPYDVDAVPVTMELTPPSNWSRVTGTGHGEDCFGAPVTLAGAVVRLAR